LFWHRAISMSRPSDPQSGPGQTADRPARKPEAPLQGSTDKRVARIRELVAIGIALSAEKRLDNLLDLMLDLIVQEAMSFTNAEGGALYTVDSNRRHLDFAIIQNRTLNIRMGGTGTDITWPPVPLYDASGRANRANVSAYCALVRETINIPDVYDAEGFDFDGTRAFDRKNQYRSRSMLVVPMLNHEDEVIGVLQLVNAMDPETGEVLTFPDDEIPTIRSLASQAAVSLVNVQLIEDLQKLLESFVQAIAQAIDEKSPYTGGHIKRVANLAMDMAAEVTATTRGPFADQHLNADQMDELRIAAWMHDVGKVSTPEYIVDKGTKLETLFDRIDLIRHRIEIMKRDAEIRYLRQCLEGPGGADAAHKPEDERARLEEARGFLEQVNLGGEFLEEEKVQRIRSLADERYRIDSTEEPLLTPSEVENLSVRKGTLTTEEREIINQHVALTIRMLEGLPFPRKYRNVPLIAGAHHERPDGTGYPRKLNAEQLPIQARILAVADVFEALTAADRPYKKGQQLSEAMSILESMARGGHVDQDVCDMLVNSGLASRYASRHLALRQLDAFEWEGRFHPAPEKQHPEV